MSGQEWVGVIFGIAAVILGLKLIANLMLDTVKTVILSGLPEDVQQAMKQKETK